MLNFIAFSLLSLLFLLLYSFKSLIRIFHQTIYGQIFLTFSLITSFKQRYKCIANIPSLHIFHCQHLNKPRFTSRLCKLLLLFFIRNTDRHTITNGHCRTFFTVSSLSQVTYNLFFLFFFQHITP